MSGDSYRCSWPDLTRVSDDELTAVLSQAAAAARGAPSTAPLNRYLRLIVLEYAEELACRIAAPWEDVRLVEVEVLTNLLESACFVERQGEVAFLGALLAEVTAPRAA